MKPPAFQYARPETLDEALALLSEHVPDAKPLAGGQSLVPVLNFRLAAPALLIDINSIPGLGRIEVADGALRIGAVARWWQIEESPVVAAENPLLQCAVRHVAHYQIRNRGTIGGSCAHADPAAEVPAVAIACGAELVLRRQGGERRVPADEFFRGPLETVLEPDELLTEVRFPRWAMDQRWAFEEFACRQGDFAIAGVAALARCGADHVCREASLVIFGVGEKPLHAREASDALCGNLLSDHIIGRSAAAAAGEIEARGDMHAPAEYRRALTRVVTLRALSRMAALVPEHAN